jgi:hypothetical protein
MKRKEELEAELRTDVGTDQAMRRALVRPEHLDDFNKYVEYMYPAEPMVATNLEDPELSKHHHNVIVELNRAEVEALLEELDSGQPDRKRPRAARQQQQQEEDENAPKRPQLNMRIRYGFHDNQKGDEEELFERIPFVSDAEDQLILDCETRAQFPIKDSEASFRDLLDFLKARNIGRLRVSPFDLLQKALAYTFKEDSHVTLDGILAVYSPTADDGSGSNSN